MGQCVIPIGALAGFTLLLSWTLRRFRDVAGYRSYWAVMMALSMGWLAVGVVTGRDLYGFASQDFSGPAGDVGMFLIFIFYRAETDVDRGVANHPVSSNSALRWSLGDPLRDLEKFVIAIAFHIVFPQHLY